MVLNRNKSMYEQEVRRNHEMNYEEWAVVPNTEGKYYASSMGRILKVDHVDSPGNTSILSKGKIISQRLDKYGYFQVTLHINGFRSKRSVHSLVCSAFHGEPESKNMQVRHLNGVSQDNRRDNLLWGTHKENGQDMRNHGRSLVGEKHHNAKLTWGDVEEIRDTFFLESLGIYPKGYITISKTASQYNVHRSTIYRIVNCKTWVRPY